MAANVCPACGAQNAEGATKCKYCGYLLYDKTKDEDAINVDSNVFDDAQSSLANKSDKWIKWHENLYSKIIASFAGKTSGLFKVKSHKMKRVMMLLKRIEKAMNDSLASEIKFSKNIIATERTPGLVFVDGELIGLGLKGKKGYAYINRFGMLKYLYTSQAALDNSNSQQSTMQRKAHYAKLCDLLNKTFNTTEKAIWAWIKSQGELNKIVMTQQTKGGYYNE